MTPEASAPIYPTPNATPLTLEATFCDKAKREILRFGVENALTRWRVICDYMQTEDWWPSVAYAELVRMGMPSGEGFSESTFRKYYSNK